MVECVILLLKSMIKKFGKHVHVRKCMHVCIYIQEVKVLDIEEYYSFFWGSIFRSMGYTTCSFIYLALCPGNKLGATRYMQWQEVHMASRSERSLRDTLAMAHGLTPASHPRTQWYWRRGPDVMRNGMSDRCTQSPEIHL